MTNFYRVGIIVNTQGLQGEVRVNVTTDFPEERFAKGTVLSLFDSHGNFVQELVVKSGRAYKNLYLVKFEEFYHINEVEKFKGMELKISEKDLTSLDDGEFYYHEIIGLDVYENNVFIGKISEILRPGANDVWVVERQGKGDLLLPYIPEVVLNVDLKNRKVNVAIMDGLDDEN